MKCEIEFGILKIYPENQTEYFAMTRFQMENVVNLEDKKLMESHFYRGSKIELINPTNREMR